MRATYKRLILFAVISLLTAALIMLAVYLKSVADYKQAIKSTSFDNINISNISDGVYIGEYDVNFIYAKVEVYIQDGYITNINILEHKNERGKSAEAITNKIIEGQKTNVDAVSGATNSSTVIKKAVENALKESQ